MAAQSLSHPHPITYHPGHIDQGAVAMIALTLNAEGVLQLRWTGDIPQLATRAHCREVRQIIREAMRTMLAATVEG